MRPLTVMVEAWYFLSTDITSLSENYEHNWRNWRPNSFLKAECVVWCLDMSLFEYLLPCASLYWCQCQAPFSAVRKSVIHLTSDTSHYSFWSIWHLTDDVKLLMTADKLCLILPDKATWHCHNRSDVHRKGASSLSIIEGFFAHHPLLNAKLISYFDNVGLYHKITTAFQARVMIIIFLQTLVKSWIAWPLTVELWWLVGLAVTSVFGTSTGWSLWVKSLPTRAMQWQPFGFRRTARW